MNLCCLECKCNNLSQIQISEQNTKLHYLHCSFNALSKNAFDEIFTILHDAIGALGFELDFAYNPGTCEIDKTGFRDLFWDVKISTMKRWYHVSLNIRKSAKRILFLLLDALV